MKSSSSEKATAWSVTINNPTEEDLAAWQYAKQLHWVREVSGQVEKGEGGTLHIQGMLRTESVRFSQVKKAFPRAHIEVARNASALAAYVRKEDTRVSDIPQVKTIGIPQFQERLTLIGIDYCKKHFRRTNPSINLNEVSTLQLIRTCELEILKDWEVIVDGTVKTLINEGYFGIEFVMSNPQVRTAYRKFLPNIMYRHVSKEASPSLSPSSQEQQESQEVD